MALGLVGWLGLAACSGLDPVASYGTVTDPEQLYLALTLELRAITLDTATGYNTIQLTATPRDGRGATLAGLPAPTFRLLTAGDSSRLRVSPEGLVTGLMAGTNINVIAELAVPGPGGYPVRHADTARVTVKTTPPPVLASLSIDPVPPDSAVVPVLSATLMVTLGLLRPTSLKPVALDTAGQRISGLVIEYMSLDPTIATVDRWSGKIQARLPGQARMVARATVSGVTQVDTTILTITWPVDNLINVVAGPNGIVLEPSEVKIVPYGIVEWNNSVGDSIDFVFDDPTNVKDPANGSGAVVSFCRTLEIVLASAEVCADGDMYFRGVDSDLNTLSARVRQFPVPGVYRFHSTRTGVTGQVVVTDEVP